MVRQKYPYHHIYKTIIFLSFILMLQLTTKLMNMFSYSISIHFILSNKDYNSCYCNPHSVYQMCLTRIILQKMTGLSSKRKRKSFGFFFLQKNPKSQTISLISTFSKQFSKLTSRVQKTRFCYAKSSVQNSISLRDNKHHQTKE